MLIRSMAIFTSQTYPNVDEWAPTLFIVPLNRMKVVTKFTRTEWRTLRLDWESG